MAVTGGLELALNCDFLVASERARFADTHARVGVHPLWGLTVLLPQAVGMRRAREMSATGNFIDARRHWHGASSTMSSPTRSSSPSPGDWPPTSSRATSEQSAPSWPPTKKRAVFREQKPGMSRPAARRCSSAAVSIRKTSSGADAPSWTGAARRPDRITVVGRAEFHWTGPTTRWRLHSGGAGVGRGPQPEHWVAMGDTAGDTMNVEAPETASLWSSLVEARSRRLETDGRWNAPVTFDGRGPESLLTQDGRKVVTFASDDYLGLSVHPAVVAAAHEALDHWGTGSGGSRAVTGSRPVHEELEAALAAWTGTERAAVFSTGYAANLGVLSAFGDSGVRICSDEHNHASIIDGGRLSHAEVAVYRHRDVAHLETLLRAAKGPALVVTDVVFPMDGDVAPVAEIAAACRRHGALLVLDEGRAVVGHDLAGQLAGVDVLRVGTLSKTLGSLGGFVAGRRAFVDLLVNRAHSYRFATAPTPPDSAAALAALRVLSAPEGERLRTRLANHIERVSPGHPSQIIPIVLGSDEQVAAASAALRERGVWVPVVRSAAGTARLRVTLTAAHTSDHIALLLDVLASVPSSPEATP